MIEELLVREDDEVEAGQVLIRLDRTGGIGAWMLAPAGKTGQNQRDHQLSAWSRMEAATLSPASAA
jgi:multidrug efflux pump subunit AcrA (membrane-fusion protein)